MVKTVTFEELEHFKILDNDQVKVITNNTESVFVVKNTLKHNHNLLNIRKLNKDEYIVLETGEIRKYNKTKYKSDEAIKRSMRKLKEILQIFFYDLSNCLFITLSTIDTKQAQDINFVKKEYQKFIRKLNAKYKNLCIVAKYERHLNGNWHIHLLIKRQNNKPIYIPIKTIKELWNCGSTDLEVVKKNTFNTMINYFTKTTQLYDVPKNVEIFTKSDNLRVKREQMTFKEFKEKIQDNYYKISQKGIIVRHIMTNKILNLHKKMVFRKRINTINKNIKKEKKAQKVITRVLSKTLKAEIIIALVYLVLFNSNIF